MHEHYQRRHPVTGEVRARHRHPGVGGPSTIEAQRLLRGLRGLDIIGADVVEVAPPFDSSGNSALVAASMMYEILCPMAKTFAARGR